MTVERSVAGRLRRLTEELAEEGFAIDVTDPVGSVLLAELDYALRPAVHERRIPSFGYEERHVGVAARLRTARGSLLTSPV